MRRRRQPAGGRRGAKSRTVRYFAWTTRPPAGARLRQTSNGGRPSVRDDDRSLCYFLFLLVIYIGRRTRTQVSVSGVTDGTDRYVYFVVLNEIFAYASIEIFRWARRFTHVNGSALSDFLRKFAERIFPLCPTDSCKRGQLLSKEMRLDTYRWRLRTDTLGHQVTGAEYVRLMPNG